MEDPEKNLEEVYRMELERVAFYQLPGRLLEQTQQYFRVSDRGRAGTLVRGVLISPTLG